MLRRCVVRASAACLTGVFMIYCRLLLSLAFSVFATLSTTGDQQVKEAVAHDNYYHVREYFKTLRQNLDTMVTNPDAYKTAISRAMIQEHIELLASFSPQNNDGVKTITVNKKQLKVPVIVDAPSQELIAYGLLKQAIETGNAKGIELLVKTYKLDLNAATLECRTALNWVSHEQGHATPKATVEALFKLGLSKKYINAYNSEGQSALHVAAMRLRDNHIGFEHTRESFQAQLAQGAIRLPVTENSEKVQKTASYEDEMKYYRAAREKGLKNQLDLIKLYMTEGALNLKNKDNKTATDILEACFCKAEAGQCKEARAAILGIPLTQDKPLVINKVQEKQDVVPQVKPAQAIPAQKTSWKFW